MKSENKILILGGDERQKHLHKMLLQRRICAKHYFKDIDIQIIKKCISQADIIILPLPVTKDGMNIYCSDSDFLISLDELVEYISPLSSVIGGMICGDFEEKLGEKNIMYYDFYTDESLINFNAHLTAQGALKIILDNSKKYIVSNKILVTGFGRISKALISFLKGLKMDVYVAARSSTQRSIAENFGFKTIDTAQIEKTVYIFDFIINTVPFNIFSEKSIENIKSDAMYIELASKPFGADKAYFEKHSKNYVLASQLPGRFYPEQSAGAILKSISDLL